MLQLPETNTDLKSHEEHFVARYERLLGWALHLTDHDHAQAEDLLHDAFIQFTLTAPELEEIRHLDNYLFGVLRVLRVSQLRRASRRRFEQLSLIEYDSAEIGLRMTVQPVEPGKLLDVRDELRAICRYACQRKETSKAGSVLILRFFHGYYPGEIAAVLRSTRKVVDMRLQSARREARLYCSGPERLGFVKTNGDAAIRQDRKDSMMALRTADDLLQELRGEIFRARNGECYSPNELEQMYDGNVGDDTLDNRQLGHIVSCAACLDAVNEILGLPALADRHPNDTLSINKRGPGNGDGGGTGAGGNVLKQQAERRARDIFEHRPQELFVAVNGFLLGSQMIHAERNEQRFELDLVEPPSFVEIFSEQGLRLLLMPIEPAEGGAEQSAKIVLSDERELMLNLHHDDTHPMLSVAYYDPLMKSDDAAQQAHDMPEPSFTRRLREFWQTVFAVHPKPWPTLVAVSLGLLLVVSLFWRWPSEPTVSAAELLQRSVVAETQLASLPGQAIHRSLSVEERDAKTGRPVSTYRVEIWQSADRGLAIRRLYDQRNVVVASEWKQTGGLSRIYQRKDAAQFNAAIPSEVWQTALSLQSFSHYVQTAKATVTEQEQAYVISYRFSADATPQLSGVTLTLGKPDLRVIEQTAVLRSTIAGGQEREFRVVEATFEQMPVGNVPPKVFQADAELSLADERGNEAAANSNYIPRQVSNAPESNTAKNLAELEIEARYLLDQVNANLGEQVSFLRQGSRLRITALVETDQRKARLLTALAPLSGNPAALFDIATYAEAAGRQSSSTAAPIVSEFDSNQSQIPAAADLRRYFAAQNARQSSGQFGSQEENRIAEFANRVQTQALKPLRHARALRNLVAQISPDEVDAITPEAKAKWRRMVQSHALAVARETAALRADLQPIFFAGVEPLVAGERNGEQSLRQVVERLTVLAASHDEIVSRAFSRSVVGTDASALKSPQFRQSLLELEALAERIAKP